jgi:chromosome partitioning protein
VLHEIRFSVLLQKYKIGNTVIGQDVVDALAAYSVPVFGASVTQRVVFAEAATQGKSVFEIDKEGHAAVEIKAVASELMEFAK